MSEDGNKELLTTTVKYGDFFNGFIKLNKIGHDFDGWGIEDQDIRYDKDGTIYDIKQDLTFYPYFTIKEYTITYDIEQEYRGSGWKQTYDINTSDYTLPTPSRRGYTFNGWKLHGKEVTKLEKGSVGNKIFVSDGWTANNYVITFNPNLPSDAQPSDVSKYDIEQIDISYDGIIPSLPKLEDYEIRDDSSIRYVKFLGWFSSATGGSEITDGSISLDGIDIHRIKKHSLRSQIGIVHYAKFHEQVWSPQAIVEKQIHETAHDKVQRCEKRPRGNRRDNKLPIPWLGDECFRRCCIC